MELIQLDELRAILEEYAKDAVEIYKYQISLGAHNASRKLADSVRSEVVVGDTAYEVVLHLEEYWKYIEGGSQGTESSPPGAVYPAHFPPVSALVDWINVKPVLPRPGDNGKIPRPESLARAIGTKILREGIEPFPAMEQTEKELNDLYRARIEEALGHDLELYIRKFIPNGD